MTAQANRRLTTRSTKNVVHAWRNPPARNPYSVAFSLAVKRLSMRFDGVDKPGLVEISQKHHVTQITAGKFAGAMPAHVRHPALRRKLSAAPRQRCVRRPLS